MHRWRREWGEVWGQTGWFFWWWTPSLTSLSPPPNPLSPPSPPPFLTIFPWELYCRDTDKDVQVPWISVASLAANLLCVVHYKQNSHNPNTFSSIFSPSAWPTWCHKYFNSSIFSSFVLALFFPSFPSHSAEYYVKVMKKIQDRGNEYVQNEQDRLGRLLSELYHPQTTQELESSPLLFIPTP